MAEAHCVIVVPCHDEERRLEPDVFVAFIDENPGIDFLFVDDGSRDGTRRVLEELTGERTDRLSMLGLDTNRGKAEAVRAGICRALENGPDAVGYWDADLATPLSEIPRFVLALRQHPSAVFILGSRVKMMGRRIERRAGRHYPGRVFATAASRALGLPVYDTQCGAKMLRATPDTEAVFERPFNARWAFDVEVIARLRDRLPDRDPHDVFFELPLDRWTHRAGSKIRLRDFFIALRELRRIKKAYPPR